MARYISRASKKPKKSKVLIFLNIVIGFLAAIAVIIVIGYLNESRDNYYQRSFGDSMTAYHIDRGAYGNLVEEYQDDRGVLGKVNENYEEAAALAAYADAAFRYKAYLESGESERAAAQKARMEEAAAGVGIYEPEIARIDRILDGKAAE